MVTGDRKCDVIYQIQNELYQKSDDVADVMNPAADFRDKCRHILLI